MDCRAGSARRVGSLPIRRPAPDLAPPPDGPFRPPPGALGRVIRHVAVRPADQPIRRAGRFPELGFGRREIRDVHWRLQERMHPYTSPPEASGEIR